MRLYTAPGCGLCDEALETLRAAQDELGFGLEVIDIEGDEELERQYRVQLPVVEVDGQQAFAFEVDLVMLLARLAVDKSG